MEQMHTENRGHLVSDNVIQDKKIKLDQKPFYVSIFSLGKECNLHFKNNTVLHQIPQEVT